MTAYYDLKKPDKKWQPTTFWFRVTYRVGSESSNSKTTVSASTPAEAAQKTRARFAPTAVTVYTVKKVNKSDDITSLVTEIKEERNDET